VIRVADYPVFPECLPDPIAGPGDYRVRFAATPEELEAVQRLRFEIFNLELGEGLQESYATGLDVDRFDAACHHLMVIDGKTDAVVGTYRIQTHEMAAAHHGFYSSDEFALEDLPIEVLESAIEIGRASVALPYRNQKVLFLLWRGLAAYLKKNNKRFLFGCCSLTSQDPAEGKWVMDHLREHGHCHPTYNVRPQPEWVCYEPGFDPGPPGEPVKLPKLFRTYMRYGAKVCGAPALDRFFKTIDYLVLLDTAELDGMTRALFFD
jgi:putative hemolysin